MIEHDGYIYHFHKSNGDGLTTYWRCQKRGSLQCGGRAKLFHGEIVVTRPHDHAPEPNDANILCFNQLIRERAQQSNEPAASIMRHALVSISEQTRPHVARLSQIAQNIRRVRGRAGTSAPLPVHKSDIDLVGPGFDRTIQGRNFLLFDSADSNRILIDGTDDNMAILRGNGVRHWFCDGTFATVPLLYEQLYTIHALFKGAVIPLLYILLPGKQESHYRQVIRALLDRGISHPATITIDFEAAAINAFSAHFPSASIHGCFYHLCQSLWRRVQQSGLTEQYRTDVQLRTAIKMLAALSFLPVDQVGDGFDDVQRAMPPQGMQIVEYFEDNYVGRLTQEGRRAPRFPCALWNNRVRIQSGLPRTNNNVKGWHSAFNRAIGAHHLNIYKFLHQLQLEQNKNEVAIARLIAGSEPPTRARKYVLIDQRLRRLVDWFSAGTSRLDFLFSVSHSINL